MYNVEHKSKSGKWTVIIRGVGYDYAFKRYAALLEAGQAVRIKAV